MSFLFKLFGGGNFQKLTVTDYQTQFNDTPHTLVDVRSALAANMLSQAGYESVYNLSGGTSRWMMQKLPLER
jgi:hypothetical protein